MPAGRPTDYTKELGDKICSGIAEGKSLKKITEADDSLPTLTTIFNWLRVHKEFLDNYTCAKEQGTEAWHEELTELGEEVIRKSQEVDAKSSNAVVQAYKLKADNMKWSMSKMKPKKYGDKLDMTTNGKDLPSPILPVIKKEE